MKTYRARLVLPLSAPPIENGTVVVAGSRIMGVGNWRDPVSGESEDLGDVVLMPGLINAHCHLDYTGMRGAILSTGNFSQWIRRINELKRTQSDDDYLAAIAAGFDELRRWGTTSVCNIEAFPELMVRLPVPPLRTWWFYELLDIRNRIHTEDVVAGALAFFDERPKWLGGFGLSPHAPYTTSLGLYDLVRACSEKYGMPLMTHLAETQEEYDMFADASGPLYDFLKNLGRNMSDTGGTTPVRHLIEGGVLPRGAMLTHMNVLADGDYDLLAQRPDLTVVHCPKCHAYFDRPPFPLERVRATGVRLCLGTDSLASNTALNLFEEMREVQQNHPSLAPADILDLVTRQPAAALGLRGRLGELTPGALADLVAVPYSGGTADVLEGVIANRAAVPWGMVNGQPYKT